MRDRQSSRQGDRLADRETDRQAGRETGGRVTDRQASRQGDRLVGKQVKVGMLGCGISRLAQGVSPVVSLEFAKL